MVVFAFQASELSQSKEPSRWRCCIDPAWFDSEAFRSVLFGTVAKFFSNSQAPQRISGFGLHLRG
jgi:hypothetical protein